MPWQSPNGTKPISWIMDLTVLLKSLRETRQETAQVAQQLLGAETRRQQEALMQQWQQVVRQAARVQW